MIDTNLRAMFDGVSRGQTEVLAALLVFTALVGFIGLNQAVLVPQDNQNTEFQHSQNVQNDMVDLRGGIIQAASSNEKQTVSVRLGMEYPDRFVSVNPPPVRGTLETTQRGDITVEDEEGDELLNMGSVCLGDDEADVDTNFLTYQANYNEFGSASPIWIENTVAHRGEAGLDTGQVIIKGNQIHIIRLEGEYRQSGVSPEDIDLIPASRTGIDTIQSPEVSSDTFELTLPTDLSQDDWETLLEDEMTSGPVETVDVDVESGEVSIDISNQEFGQYIVRCSTVGIEEKPDVNPARSPPLTDDPTSVTNPFGPDTLELFGVESDGGDDLTATFLNRYDDDIEIKEIRIPYVTSSGKSSGEEVEVRIAFGGQEWESDKVEIGGDWEDVEVEDPLGAGEEMEAGFDGFPTSSNTELGVEIRIEDPDENTRTFAYFLSEES